MSKEIKFFYCPGTHHLANIVLSHLVVTADSKFYTIKFNDQIELGSDLIFIHC
jgi:hypothetical protein